MDNVTYDDAVMGEEFFGPIMPILAFDDFDAVVDELKQKDTMIPSVTIALAGTTLKRQTIWRTQNGGYEWRQMQSLAMRSMSTPNI